VLLTRLPLYSPLRVFAFDLHVLGTPPALILSQDQTLMLKALASALARRDRTFNARSLLIDGSLYVVQFVKLMDGSQLASEPELTAPQRLALRHPLILDGLCLHVLSSFQRTGIARPLATPTVFGGTFQSY
jgi:hypothetical protein